MGSDRIDLERLQLCFELEESTSASALLLSSLVRGLRDLVDEKGDAGADSGVPSFPTGRDLRTEQAMLPREAFFARAEKVKPAQAVGRVGAELITPYPPGIPAVAPGELYTEELVGYLEEFVRVGGFVEGADPTLGQLRVVA